MRYIIVLLLVSVVLLTKAFSAQEEVSDTAQTLPVTDNTVVTTVKNEEGNSAVILAEDKIEVYDTIPDCHPPCRAGYYCHNGTCISLCNPPCPEGTRCDPKIGDCVPIHIPSQLPSQQKEVTCKKGEILVDDDCLTKKDIYTTGNVFFTITNIFFGIGTSYSAVAPLIVQKYSWREGYYDDYGMYPYYNEPRYDEFDAIVSTAPQTGMFVIAGLLNQMPKMMQKNRLEELGETPNSGLIAASWALWGASIGTATTNIFNNLTEDRSTIITSGVINCVVLFTSYLVSNITYISQQNKLKMAVQERLSCNNPEKQTVTITPYYAYSNMTNKLGLLFQF